MAAVLAASVLGAACGDDAVTNATAAAGDPLLQKVVEMGFDPAQVQDMGDFFVAEGDIVIEKATLVPQREAAPADGRAVPGRPRTQYSSTYHPNTSGSLYGMTYQMKVDLSAIDAEHAGWAAAVRGAMQQWNTIPGVHLGLTETPWNSNAPVITVVFGTCPAGAIACATFPTQKCDWLSCWAEPGNRITITRNFHHYSDSQKLYVVTHEMGHTIGFRHTNWNNRTCFNQSGQPYTCAEPVGTEGAVHIPGTPTSTFGGAQSDPYSVMNATIQTWQGFSYYDRVAARYLFPGGPGPTPTPSLSGSNPRIDWAPMTDAVAYEVWYVEPQSCGWMCYGPAPAPIETYVGTTTSTYFVDGSRTASTPGCTGFMGYEPPGYSLKAVFPNNAKSNLGPMATFC